MGPALVHAYGANSGPLAVYFHGAPGGPGECARFDGVARACGVRLVCIDRSVVAADLAGEPYFRTLAREVDALAGGAPVTFIGFSLGAFVALRTAPHLAARVASIHLISAGAPLESGDFLDGMAGKAVFRMAGRSPHLFRRLSRFQGWLAAHAPGGLFRMLFATATGRDRDLARDEGFRTEIGAVLKGALASGANGYVRDVEAYVRPWASRLAEVTADSHIWHGAEDNWAPAAMASRLKALLPNVPRIEIMPGLSHYSCLFQAVPRILAAIGAQIHLRPAIPADHAEIVALTNRAFRETGPQASWNVEDLIEGERINESLLRDDLAAPGAHLLIWRDGAGEHLGHVRLDAGAEGVWFLGLLTVRPDRQDAGLGRTLLAAAEDWARARGCRRMRMTVIHQRETLIAWYLRRGYALTGETKPFPYDDTRFGRPTRPDLYFDVLEKGL